MRSLPAGIILGVLYCSRIVAQGNATTAASLPLPTGPHIVGTSIAYLVDQSRPSADFPAGRPITVQLWYPATRSKHAPAQYLAETGLSALLQRVQYYGIDRVTAETWVRLRTHSTVDSPPVKGKHPLLAFSVGLGVIRANYTSIAEELASYGYVVALVESPMQGIQVLPGGREILDSAGKYKDPKAHRTGVADWSRDISFVLDRLRDHKVPRPMMRVASAVDWSRLGAIGHSSGGLVAVATCERDSRVRACVNMDGGIASPEQQPLADFVETGITKPTLFLRSQPLYDEADFARRGLTREQWEKRGEPGRLAFKELVGRSKGPLWVAFVAGTGHFSFTDAPFILPATLSRFGGRIIDPERGWNVITTTIRAFFDGQFHERGGEDLGEDLMDLAHRFSELSITFAK